MVNITALGLTIGAMRADSLNLLGTLLLPQTFIDLDAEPIKSFLDIFLCAGHKTGAVGIFDTQQHITAVLTGKQVVIQRGTHTADVQCAGGTWRKTNSNSSFHRYKTFAAAKVLKKNDMCKF